MKSQRSFRIGIIFVLLVALLMTVGIVYAATVIIDSFDLGQQILTASSGSPAASEGITVSGVVGGARKAFITHNGGGTNVNLDIDTNIGGGVTSDQLSFSMGAGTTGTGRVIWDSTTVTDTTSYSGLSANLVDSGPVNDGILITVLTADHNTALTLTAYDGAAANNATQTFPIVGDNDLDRLDLFYRFADFTESGTWNNASDWGDVGALVLDIDGTIDDDLDLTIDNIEAEPGADIREYGDLDSDYGSLLDAYHIPQGLTLGYNLDAESTDHASLWANGDNTNDFDDEDGVTPSNPEDWLDPLIPGVVGQGEISVVVNGCASEPCYLSAWLDMDNNNNFTGSWTCSPFSCSELLASDESVYNGTPVSIDFWTPLVQMEQGWKYARFRVCPTTGTCNNPGTVAVVNGEIEDYVWYVGGTPTAVNLQSFSANNTTTLSIIGIAVVAVLALVSVGIFIARREQKQA